jgi:hypothetical protein
MGDPLSAAFVQSGRAPRHSISSTPPSPVKVANSREQTGERLTSVSEVKEKALGPGQHRLGWDPELIAYDVNRRHVGRPFRIEQIKR